MTIRTFEPNLGFRQPPVDYSQPAGAPEPKESDGKPFGLDLRRLLVDDVVARSKAATADPDAERFRLDFHAPQRPAAPSSPQPV